MGDRDNRTTDIPISSSHLSLTEYDALPRAIRKLLQDAPYSLSLGSAARIAIRNGDPEIESLIRNDIPRIIGLAARETYGPDHPQAR